MAEQERRTVKVLCTIPNGLELRLFKEGHDDGAGVRHQVVDGSPVTLKGSAFTAGGVQDHEGLVGVGPIVNEVDAEFMEKWLEQNKLNVLVATGAVCVVEEEAAAK